MQDLGIFSFLCCVLCIYSVFRGWQILSHWIFAASILFLLGSIILSGLEINKSTKAIEVKLSDMEELNGATIFTDIFKKDESYLIRSLTEAVGKDDDFRADISSVIATRLVNYSLMFAEKNSVPQQMIDTLIKLTTDCDSFTDDLKYYIVKVTEYVLMARRQSILRLSPRLSPLSIFSRGVEKRRLPRADDQRGHSIPPSSSLTKIP